MNLLISAPICKWLRDFQTIYIARYFTRFKFSFNCLKQLVVTRKFIHGVRGTCRNLKKEIKNSFMYQIIRISLRWNWMTTNER